jgi:60 kDa SS-A/Ro ribonucleoprotein
MARLNTAPKSTAKTHEGAPAFGHLKPIQQLRRSVLSCLLWEREFYEDGKSIADRISETAALVKPADLASLAIEARKVFNLRHVPLLLLDVLSRTGPDLMADTTFRVIDRPDEMAELLAVYWRNGRKTVPRQMRIGLQRAFAKFDEYRLAKYRNG